MSRAFRNRFVELHFDELPSEELETILHQRCSLPPSYCTKLVKVMQNLQVRAWDGTFRGKKIGNVVDWSHHLVLNVK